MDTIPSLNFNVFHWPAGREGKHLAKRIFEWFSVWIYSIDLLDCSLLVNWIMCRLDVMNFVASRRLSAEMDWNSIESTGTFCESWLSISIKKFSCILINKLWTIKWSRVLEWHWGAWTSRLCQSSGLNFKFSNERDRQSKHKFTLLTACSLSRRVAFNVRFEVLSPANPIKRIRLENLKCRYGFWALESLNCRNSISESNFNAKLANEFIWIRLWFAFEGSRLQREGFEMFAVAWQSLAQFLA